MMDETKYDNSEELKKNEYTDEPTKYSSSDKTMARNLRGQDERELAGCLVSFSKSGGNGELFELKQGENKIGRNTSNSIVFQENQVSGEHANLKVIQDGNNYIYEIVVTSSSKAIKVNDVLITNRITLHDKDRIEIGGYSSMLIVLNKHDLKLKENESFMITKSNTRPKYSTDGHDYYQNNETRMRNE